jgi:hypothetical protein
VSAQWPVGARRRDDHQLALGLAESVGAFHQRVVVVEERAQLGRPVAERAEDVRGEPGLLRDHADALAQVFGAGLPVPSPGTGSPLR